MEFKAKHLTGHYLIGAMVLNSITTSFVKRISRHYEQPFMSPCYLRNCGNAISLKDFPFLNGNLALFGQILAFSC